MRGIVLAGGSGTRLKEITGGRNKHALQLCGRPMIHWPLATLLLNNIRDITVVSSGQGIAELAPLLGSRAMGAALKYRVQEEPRGIPDAILAACEPANKEPVAVILGDNFFLDALPLPREIARARIVVTRVEDPRQFGVVDFDGNRLTVTEKPTDPRTNLALCGLFCFSPDVFNRISVLTPSDRGELEIADLLNDLARDNLLSCQRYDGFWGDAGTPEGLRRVEGEIRRRA
jgi:glucose-1-phosphate thymidylyltransferase